MVRDGDRIAFLQIEQFGTDFNDTSQDEQVMEHMLEALKQK